MLATSREPLAIAGETVWRVSTLRLPSRTDLSPEELRTFEAVQLFVDRARGALPAFGLTRQNAPAIALICRRLDGLPLAIELAAARLNVLTAEQIATRLTDRLRLLVGGKRLAPARQQTLKATIDWSYDLLSDAERRLFQALAVFAGGCSLDAVEAVRDGSSVEATARLDVLGQLIDKSLVVAKPDSDGTVRYVLHETLREYGVERLAGSGELEEARRRHASYYAGFVQPAEAELRGQDQARWLHELGREHDNLRAALGWALERGAGAVGAQFGAALWRFWVYRGFLAEAEASLTRVLALPGPDTSTRLQVLLGAAILAHSSGDMIRTRALFEDLHKRASNIGDARLTAAALMQLGQIARATGDLVRARALLTESLAVWQDLNESRGIAQSLESLGALALTEGDRPMARRLLTEALEITRSVADATQVGFVLCWLGWVAVAEGDLTAARAQFGEGLSLFRELQHPQGIARALQCFAALSVAEGQPERGLRLFGASAAQREAFGYVFSWLYEGVDRRAKDARQALGDEAADAAWTVGHAMPVEQAVHEALAPPMPAEDCASVNMRRQGLAGGLTQRDADVVRPAAAG